MGAAPCAPEAREEPAAAPGAAACVAAAPLLPGPGHGGGGGSGDAPPSAASTAVPPTDNPEEDAADLTEEEVVRRGPLSGKYVLTGKVIYKGLASTIFLAVDKSTLLQVGVKVLMKNKFDSDVERRNAQAEVEIHSSIPPHNNIIRLLDSQETAAAILLVIPYTPHGDLWDLVRYGKTYCEAEVRKCAAQILSAMHHIHAVCGFVHGDVKPQNFLLLRTEGKYSVQLCDFGLAERPKTPSGLIHFQCLRGTSGWFAPEMLAHRDYSYAMDLFGCGLILFRMLGGYPPFDPPSRFQVVEFDDRCWCHISEPCRHLIAKLLSIDPEGRGTAFDALDDEWVCGDTPVEPSPEQLQKLRKFGPPPCRDVQFWDVDRLPEPHLRNSYADLQTLIKQGWDPGNQFDSSPRRSPRAGNQ